MAMASLDSDSICYDILRFQELIKKMRVLDDKIIHSLNSCLPTDSFRGKVNGETACKQLHGELLANYSEREKKINHCIDVLATEVRSLKQQRTVDPDNLKLIKNLRREQTSLRLLQTELSVEEVIKERTMKVFGERCNNYQARV